ncbi:hypothetical protein HNR46_004028, partial [Haloferula luteola]|nr:hypothetical protein [Haloferula luteola]
MRRGKKPNQEAQWLVWSVPLKSWTDNKELEERRTKVPYQTKSGTLFG